MSNVHELLPWYVNETLEPSEIADFERHLAACADCREELALLRGMRARLEARGDAPLRDHPSAQRLADILSAGEGESDLTVEEAARVRRHLDVCLTCAEEAGWTSGAARAIRESAARVAAAGSGSPAGPGGAGSPGMAPVPGAAGTTGSGRAPSVSGSAEGPWRRILPWGWAVAAALAIVVGRGIFVGSGIPPDAAGIAVLHTVEPVTRAEGEPAEIVVARDAAFVNLVFPVDAAPASFPLRLEILDAAGRRVHLHERITAGDLSNGELLFLSLRRADLPEGTCIARLTSPDGRATATEYRFRVAGR